MEHITNIQSNGAPNSIEIFGNEVFIPLNVHELNEQTEDGIISGYQYDCDIYTKDEYITLMAQQTARIAQLEDELAAAKILLGVDE